MKFMDKNKVFLVITAIILFFSGTNAVHAANICQSNGTGGGNFNVATTWTSCPNAGTTPINTPAVGDSIVILNGDTVTLTTSPTVAGVTINNGGILNETTFTLTDSANFTDNGSVTGTTGKLTLTGSGSTIDGTGTYTPTGIVTVSTGAKTIASGSHLTFPNLTVTGVTVTNNSTAGFTVSTALAGVGGTLTQGAGSILNIGGTSAIATINASVSTNEVHYTGAAQTIHTGTYHHLFVDGSGIKTLGGVITVNGNLTVTAGSLSDGGFQITGNGTGTFTMPAGSTLTLGLVAAATTFPTGFTTSHISLDNTSTVNYNSTSAQTISSVPNYGNLTLTGASVTKTADGAIMVNGNLSNATALGVLADGGFTITVKGNSTMTGTETGTGKILFSGGAGAHIVTGAGYNNVELNDTSFGVTQNASMTVGGTLTITNGTWTSTNTLAVTGTTSVATSQTLSIGTTGTHTFGDVTVNGVWDNSANEIIGIAGSLSVNTGATFTSGTAVYTFSGATKTIDGTIATLSIPNLTITGTITSSSTSLTVGTSLIVTSPGTFTNKGTVTATTALSGTGTFIQNSNSILNIGGTTAITALDASVSTNEVHYTNTAAQTIRAGTYWHLFSDNKAATIVNTLGGAITVNGNLTITGSITDAGFQITGNSTGTFSMTASSTLILGTAATATSFPTSFTNAHISLATTNVVNYNSNAPQTISNVPTYGNLTTTATVAVTKTAAGNLTVTGNLNNGSNNTLADGGFTITVNGNVAMGGAHSGTGKILLTGGSAVHVLSGNGDLANIELNDSNGVTETVNTTISGTLTITAGTWTINSGNLIVTGTTSISGTLAINSSSANRTFGDMTINSGGVLSFGAAANQFINGNFVVNGNGTGSGPITGTAGIFTFQKVGGGSISGNSSITIPGAATFSTTYTIPATFTVNTTMSVGAAAIEVNTGTVTANVALTGAGTFTQNSGTILNVGSVTITTLNATAAGNIVHYTGLANGTIKGTSYVDLDINKTSGNPSTNTATANGTVNVAGNLTVTAGTFNLFGSIFTVTGNTDIYGTLTDSSGGPAGGRNTFIGLVNVHSGANWNGVNGEVCDFHFGNGLIVNGSFTDGSGSYIFETNNQSVSGSLPLTIQYLDVNNIHLTNQSIATISKALTSSNATVYSGTGANPRSIASDHTNMWTANFNGNSVTKIAPNGSMTTYTGTGTGPEGIAFDGTNMWTANYSSDSVTEIAPDGSMTTYTGAGTNPNAIAFDGTNMWTANAGNNSVTKVASDGSMTTYTGTGAGPSGIAFDGTNMWTANYSGNSVTKIASNGSMTTYTGTGINPYSIAFDGTNMWTANYSGNSVTKIAPNGSMTTYTGAGISPQSIAFDGTNMWTANYSGDSVTKIAPDGNMTTSYSGIGISPIAIAFDGTNMWTANYNTNSVTKIVPTDSGVFVQGAGVSLNLSGTATASYLDASAVGNTVNYNGASAQTLNVGTYQTLGVSGNTNGNVNIISNTTADTGFNLGATILSTASNTMSIGPGATVSRTTGFVNGNLQKNVSAGSPSPTFEIGSGTDYTPISLNFHTVTISGNIIASTTPVDHPDIATSNIIASTTANRFWTISNSGVSFGSYDATFNFVPADVDAGANTANFVLAKFASGVWLQPNLGAVTSSSVSATGITSFGDFQVGEMNAPVTQFILNNPGDMNVSTRLGYTVNRKDQLNNAVTFGTTTVYLYSSSNSATKKFYDAATNGNIITSIEIPNGQSSVNFWYYDETAGTYTITTSDNSSAPDGATGIADGTDSVIVIQTAVKFVIQPVTGITVDAPAVITIEAQKPDNSVDTNYQNDVTLNTNGSATGGGLVNIINGVGTINISDTVAETVTLSLTDSQSTGLNISSTEQVIFAGGATAQFVLSHPGTLSAGSRAQYTVTRKDQYNNLTTTGTTDVYLYSSSLGTNKKFYDAATNGNIITSINIPDGQTMTDFWYYDETPGNYTITASDNSLAPDGNININDAVDSLTAVAGPVATFVLNHPGDMTAGTRLGYTVSRQDQFGNPVTSSDTAVYLFSSSVSTSSSFFNASSGGSAGNSILISNGNSSANFWYYDETPGNYTITASDNSSAPDGAAGIADGMDSFLVNAAPIVATRFVILNPGNGTADAPVTVTIQAQDGSGNLDTSYQTGVTLNTSGSAIGAGLVTIVNGVGTMNISDTAAESVTLSLTDSQSTGLDVSSSQNIVFSTGVVAQFSLDNPGDMSAGTRLGYTVTRKDQFGNPVTSGVTKIYLYGLPSAANKKFYDAASGGSVITFVNIPNGYSSAQFWYYDEHAETASVVVSDNPSAPDGAAGIADVSDQVIVSAGPVAKFILNNPGNMTAGTRLGYTISRQDQFGNPVTTGVTLAYLYTSSTGTTTTFYDSSSAGFAISSVPIDDGSPSANFWYFDETPGAWNVTVSDSAPTPDGNTGITDDSDSVTVTSIPIVATRFVIINPGDTMIGVPVNVVVKAEDANGNTDTTYQSDVTLVTSGSATGAGLVNIINGVGSLQINDVTAQAVSLSLSDTQSTGLNVSSATQINFSALPPVFTSGGSAFYTAPPIIVGRVTFSGVAYPGAVLSIAAISKTENIIKQGNVSSADGSFSITFTGLSTGARSFALLVQDKDGRIAQSKVYDLNLLDSDSVLTVDNIIVSPTIGFPRPTVTKGDFIAVIGYATPRSVLTVQVDGQPVTALITAGTDGLYKYLYNTAGLNLGSHTIRALQTVGGGQSEFSPQKIFFTTNLYVPKTDFNNDGKLNVSDWSIFLSRWVVKDPTVRILDDLNNDGKVDVTDFSIFIRTLKQQ